MSMQGHLAELERRHQMLSREIDAFAHQPSSDELKLAELKRKKLLLKDEIRKCREVAAAPVH